MQVWVGRRWNLASPHLALPYLWGVVPGRFDGNVGDHFSTYASCPGSGEPTPSPLAAPSEEGQDALAGRVVELAKAVVRAPQPGARYRCESQDELRERLAHAGVKFDPEDLSAALEVLEQNGVGALDTDALPGLPYRVLRPE
jgi:hypothetical protein